MTQALAQEFPAQRVCQVLDCPRSSHYYQSKRAPRGPARADAEQPLRQAIQETAGQWPTYGYRRLGQQLRREGQVVNSKRLRRLMCQMGILGKRVVRKRRTTDSTHSLPRFENRVAGLSVTRPDQVWVADITYIRLGGGFVYLAVIMDVFTRAIRGWHLSKSLDGDLTLMALRRAMQDRLPAIHHSDQGVQYAAAAYVQLLQERGVAVSMAAVGEPTENGYAERLMRTIKEEHVDLTEYRGLADALRQIGAFLEDVYNCKRIHSRLSYLTPAEFEERFDEQSQQRRQEEQPPAAVAT